MLQDLAEPKLTPKMEPAAICKPPGCYFFSPSSCKTFLFPTLHTTKAASRSDELKSKLLHRKHKVVKHCENVINAVENTKK